jgi:ABC-2 type transport system ATP-binding protein
MNVNVIEVKGLKKSYGQVHAVRGVDLSIPAGEIFALLGPNGAGKTTTVEILEGFRSRDAGQISILGFDPQTQGHAARQWRDRIGIVLQSAADAGDLTVIETVEHFRGYYSKPRNTDEVIAAVGLENKTGALIRNLSGGQRRRAFWTLIEQLRGDGTTILLTTHYLDEAEALADRVAVINNGLIVEVSTPAELGGRATSRALISWRDGSQVKSEESDNPTSVVTRLTAQFGGEIPELTVTRPSLEDIYLKMIGGVHEQDS